MDPSPNLPVPSEAALPAPLWPLGAYVIEDAPEDPLFQAIGAALAPLRPILRWLTYEATPQKGVTLGLGGAFHLASVHLKGEDTLLLDLPVGEMDRRAETLVGLLQRNHRRVWSLRVDSVSPASDTTPEQVVVVIERQVPLVQVGDLAELLLQGWREKLLTRGLLRGLDAPQEFRL